MSETPDTQGPSTESVESEDSTLDAALLPPGTIVGPGLPALHSGAYESQGLATAIVATLAPPEVPTSHRLKELREVYWHNVTREMLVAFAMLAQRNPDIADGRVSVVTTLGERIPLGGVEPLFPCTVVSDARSRALCTAVQCTVFNIRTPVGEVVTLPLHEIVSVRVLSDELLRELEAAARSVAGAREREPFGFAAYTSLARDPQNAQRMADGGRAG